MLPALNFFLACKLFPKNTKNYFWHSSMEVWLGNTDLDCPSVTSNLLGTSVPYFQTLSTCILPLVLRNHIYHPHKNSQNYSSVYFNFYIFLTADGKTKDSEVNGSKYTQKLKLLLIPLCMLL